MNWLWFLKLWGAGVVERSLAAALKRRMTQPGYGVLGGALSRGVSGCVAFDADAVAQGLTDALFLIR